MIQNTIKTIGKKQTAREEALLFNLDDVEGIVDTLEKDFLEWSDFDLWDNMYLQKWIFSRAMNVYSGKKIDIKCWCCETIDLDKIQLKNISNQKCYGLKISSIVEKVVEEIELAQVRRESDGTYLS